MSEFCHLHCHTQYSLLDGAAKIGSLITRAAEMEVSALAITDHGNLYGVPEFYTKARDAGVQPIIGCEFYLTPSGMADKSDRTRYHQVLLAKNLEGYRNLIKLASLANTEGYYYKPRIDRETLRKYSNGLVATTCCLQGEVLQAILKKSEAEARAVFEDYLDIFGDDYYIEVQDHAIPEQRQCNAVLQRWAKEYGVTVVATNDVHYVYQEDAEAQDVLLCLQTGKDLHDPNRMRFENDQFYLKSEAEMRHAFMPSLGEGVFESEMLIDSALTGTKEIADKCKLELPMGELLMPHFPIPSEHDGPDAFLKFLSYEGARGRYGGVVPEPVRERLDFELGVIQTMGYAGYFLITQDFTTAARDMGVSVGPGRGSAAGSLVAYALGITNIDPLAYDLLFERFLNPERVSMPDIDIDFDDRGRGKVIDYVVEKYGRESVCQIVTFGTMGSKSVIRDVSRVLGVPLAEADRISKLVPDGVKVSLEDAKGQVKEFADLYRHDDPQIRKLMHYATVLEGSARHTGIHAAGVIIAPGNVSDYVPVAVQKGKSGAPDAVVTQYDGKWIEEFGLLKMDFLGLKTLTILNDALGLIKENHGVEIDLDAIPLDDPATYRLFQRGDTVAIFQFESSGMREWMRKLKPTTLDDLIAMNALYRPGPMDLIPTYIDRKHGKETVEYPHEMLRSILEPTFGIPVYQEQVMQMAQVMGGYSLGGADLLRRAMGKKKQSEMDKQRVTFVAGAAEKGVSEQKANEVFDMMAKFAGYGFNKSHSAAYSVVAYQTAYLKAHYPAEFMAAVMTTEMSDSSKMAIALEATRQAGIDILPPCVNRSSAYFNVENGAVRFGLGAIKGVGLGAIEKMLEAREKAGGAFEDLFEMVRDLDLRTVGKKTIEALACAGALDMFEGHRAQLAEAVPLAWQYAQKHQADTAAGQNSLFGGDMGGVSQFVPQLPHKEPWGKGEALRHERDLMGFYVSGHPLDDYAAEAKAFASVALNDTERVPHESDQTICGILTSIERKTTKSGRPIAFLTVEDTGGACEVVCFAQTLERFGHLLEADMPMLVRGKAETSRGDLKLIAKEVLPMWRVREQLVQAITLKIDASGTTPEAIEELAALCAEHKGAKKLYIELEHPGLPRPVRLHARTAVVDLTPDLMKGLNKLVGRESVVLETEAV
ncbi:DNA polymerase III subunit alpha [Rubricoccus marinus]|uniref:DNA polymerase III subunit alpha n=1 Tax=Rubricoccus marinus TaxID=716817 RepID=A0A259TZA8_9BACT|nr:DNA polymerase III subunit alpha [Rubricoccus marinus]OZC03030.1 DNA polymerase III subunit alpha [Rubricoccus marinus]